MLSSKCRVTDTRPKKSEKEDDMCKVKKTLIPTFKLRDRVPWPQREQVSDKLQVNSIVIEHYMGPELHSRHTQPWQWLFPAAIEPLCIYCSLR